MSQCLPKTVHCQMFFCCTADSLSLDPEVSKANAYGFTGCLSSVQYNHIAPLKAALRHPSVAPVTVRGSLTESNCASMMEADVNTATMIYSSSGVSCWEGTGEFKGHCGVRFPSFLMRHNCDSMNSGTRKLPFLSESGVLRMGIRTSQGPFKSHCSETMFLD